MSPGPQRIALVTPLYEGASPSRSGIAKHYRHLADALCRQGHQVTVFTTPDIAANTDPVDPAAGLARVIVTPARIPAFLDARLGHRWLVRKLLHTLLSIRVSTAALCRHRLDYDVIEATSFNSLPLGHRLLPGRAPVIVRVSTTADQITESFHTFRSRAQSWVNRLETTSIRRADLRLTHTRLHAREIEHRLGLTPDRFAIIPHGIPDLPAAPLPPPLTHQPRVLFAGQFTQRKAIDVVLAAAPRLFSSSDARLVIAGGPRGLENTPDFLALHSRWGHRLELHLDPDDAQLGRLIEQCDIFTAPSRYESFGLIYLEAMRAARPVVATRAGGIPEVVADGETGLLVPPGDADTLATAWLRLAARPDERLRLGQAGRRRFLDHFTADIMAARSARLYAEIQRLHSAPPC